MRKAAVALIICLLINAGSLYAACKSEACKQATAWKTDYTAIILDDNISRADYFAVLDAVKANNGVVGIEAEHVLLGWAPIRVAGKIRGTRGVRSVLYEAVSRPADLVHGDEAVATLSFFNKVRTGEWEDVVEAGLAVHGRPLTSCVPARPISRRVQATTMRSVFDSPAPEETRILQKVGGNLPSDEPAKLPLVPGVISPKWGWFQTPYRNTHMRGRISVQFFRLDSDGSIDPDLYTWTTADISTSRDQMLSAFTFWVDQAAARGITLSFSLRQEDPFNRNTRSFYPSPTHYEPITHYSTDDYLWINDALTPLGYGASPVTPDNVYTKNEAFNLDKAAESAYGPFDGSFSLYLVYNPGDAPDHFKDGAGAYVGFLGGPYEIVSWNSSGWGPSNLGRIVTHETGHIFWACDEYASGCNSCYYCAYNVGPRNRVETPWITNANCEHTIDDSFPTCDAPRTSCMMKGNDYVLCPHTPGQIGWEDPQ